MLRAKNEFFKAPQVDALRGARTIFLCQTGAFQVRSVLPSLNCSCRSWPARFLRKRLPPSGASAQPSNPVTGKGGVSGSRKIKKGFPRQGWWSCLPAATSQTLTVPSSAVSTRVSPSRVRARQYGLTSFPGSAWVGARPNSRTRAPVMASQAILKTSLRAGRQDLLVARQEPHEAAWVLGLPALGAHAHQCSLRQRIAVKVNGSLRTIGPGKPGKQEEHDRGQVGGPWDWHGISPIDVTAQAEDRRVPVLPLIEPPLTVTGLNLRLSDGGVR